MFVGLSLAVSARIESESKKQPPIKLLIMLRFEGKTAIVTGGSAGIGRAIVVRLAAEGCRVLIGDRDQPRGETLSRDSARGRLSGP